MFARPSNDSAPGPPGAAAAAAVAVATNCALYGSDTVRVCFSRDGADRRGVPGIWVTPSRTELKEFLRVKDQRGSHGQMVATWMDAWRRCCLLFYWSQIAVVCLFSVIYIYIYHTYIYIHPHAHLCLTAVQCFSCSATPPMDTTKNIYPPTGRNNITIRTQNYTLSIYLSSLYSLSINK